MRSIRHGVKGDKVFESSILKRANYFSRFSDLTRSPSRFLCPSCPPRSHIFYPVRRSGHPSETERAKELDRLNSIIDVYAPIGDSYLRRRHRNPISGTSVFRVLARSRKQFRASLSLRLADKRICARAHSRTKFNEAHGIKPRKL